MIAKRFFNPKTSGIAMVFCALCLFVIMGTETKSNAKSLSANNNNSFQQQLLERSQKYLDSIRQRSANLPPELQEKLKLQTQNTVNKGLAKLNHPAKLVQKQTTPANLTAFSNTIQKIGKISALKVAEFLSRDFCCVTELDVAVRVALPSWNYRQNCRFTVKNSSTLLGSFGFGCSNNRAVVVPVSPRDIKTWAKILGQPAFVSIIDTKSISHRVAGDDSLSGFTLIAQTVIQRK
ncbi:MAG: hypothetical protein LBG58_12565 [Planctomycetaceae bacterium]|jgi:hypothetical protein|nr:hypothetical protein [Planctomycetaceae bacterium]